jgi:SHS2 domain-containing protein
LTKTVTLEGEETDYLLFDWLNELLFTFDTERLLLAEFDVRVATGSLRATCRGELLDADRHSPDREIKAITYHGLQVRQESEGWLAEVIVDL